MICPKGWIRAFLEVIWEDFKSSDAILQLLQFIWIVVAITAIVIMIKG